MSGTLNDQRLSHIKRINVPLEQARLKMMEADLAFFSAEALGMLVGDHHIEWSRLASDYKKVAIQASRDHGKSAFWSYAYPLWQSWRIEKADGVIVANTQDQSYNFLDLMQNGKRYVDDKGVEWYLPSCVDIPALQGIIPPNPERVWSKGAMRFANGSQIRAKAFGTKFRGLHPTWIVVDDPLGDESAYSERVREKDKAIFTRAITPMLVPSGQMIVVGTPMHGNDLHALLATNSEYFHKKYPALILNDEGEEVPLWPTRYSVDVIRAREREVGPLAFAQEYLLKPVSNETSLFPPSLFQGRMDKTVCMKPALADISAMPVTVYMGVDFAMSSSVGADFTVITVLSVTDAGVRTVIDIVRVKGMSFQNQLELIKDTWRRYDADMVFCESNQMQRIFGEELARTTDMPVYQFNTSASGKNSLQSGVPALRTLIENDKFVFPTGDEYSARQTRILIDEMTSFAWIEGKLRGVGTHDDCVMSLWIADQAVRKGAFQFGFADQEDYSVIEDRDDIEDNTSSSGLLLLSDDY
jgi:hypothetical protein